MVVLQWAPTLVVALVVCLGPGLMVTFALGMRGSMALALAPHFSILVVVASGGLARSIGAPLSAPFGPLVLVAVLTLSVLVALAARGVGARPARTGDMRWVVGSVGLGALALGVALLRAIGTPEGWPQMPDNIFHVGSVTWMLRHETWWMGDVGGYTGGSGGFTAYPGAWHSLAVAISAWSGSSALSASHALVLVVGGVVWPLGCVLLSHLVIDDSKLTTFSAAIGSLIFFMMPVQHIAWGVVWPYLLGLSLLPGCLAALLYAARALSSGTPPGSQVRLWVIVGAVCAAAVMSHSSMVYVLLLLGVPLVIVTIWAGPRRQLAPLVMAIAAVVIVLAWSIRPHIMLISGSGRPRDLGAPVVLLTLGALSPNGWLALVLTAILGVAAISLSREKGNSWVAIGAVAPLLLSFAVMTLPTVASTALSWPWWNEAARIRAVAAPCAVVAIVALGQRVATSERIAARLAPQVRAGVAVVITALTTLGLHASSLHLATIYAPADPDRWWVTAADREDLRAIADLIPTGATVAADPYRGGTHLYLTHEVNLLFPTERAVDEGGDKALIGRALASGRQDPDVCRALSAYDVRYVVTGSRRTSWGIPRLDEYSGFQEVGSDTGFSLVSSQGDFELWRFPECQQEAIG